MTKDCSANGETIANVIALGERSPRYAVNWVTLGFTRSF
jgi:hypothetical protein